MNKMLCLRNFAQHLLAVLMFFALVACGGGGESPFSDNNGGGGGGGVTALAADQNVSTNTIVTLDGSRSTDPRGGQLHYSWHFVEIPEGSQATLSNPSAVRPTFTPDKDGIYLLILVVTNSRSESAECFITVTAASGNSAPVANPGSNQSVTTGNTVTLDGSASSDADGNTITYSWAFVFRPFGSQAALSNPSAAKPTFTPDMDGQYVLALIVFDGTTFSAPVTITITASTTNTIPIANPGVDQNVAIGNLVTLDGSQSSVSGSATLTYSWSFVSKPAGSDAELSSFTTVKPTFLPDVGGDYVISLIVNDGNNASDPITVTVTVFIENSVPVANAGVDQNVATGTLVTLDGSTSSDADGDNLSFSWSFISLPEGSTAQLSNLSAAKPTFIPDLDGDYVFRLVVNDGTTQSTPSTVTVTASTANSAPVANAGSNQNIATGAVVTLDGSASSDADGDLLSFTWSFVSVPDGSQATLSDVNAVKPTFTPDVDGDYVVRLVVYDGSVESTAVTITITSATQNSAPMAHAGADQNVTTGTLVTLDGSASSDADGDLLSFTWSFISKPDGSQVTLSDTNAAKPNFIPDMDGDYVIRLVVHDGLASSNPDTVTITAATVNSAPVAHAGADQNVTTGTLVTLDGSASSDADGDLLSFTWAIVSVPDGSQATLFDATAATPTFTPDVDGDYVVRLVVNDGELFSSADTVIITAATANSAPIAHAGSDQRIARNSMVTLDGSESSDSDGDLLSYAWSFVSMPEGSEALLFDATSIMPTFIPDLGGDYVVRLVVHDGRIESNADTVTVKALNPGEELWSLTLGAIYGRPVIGSDDTIYVLNNTNHIYAIDPSGIIKWNRNGNYHNPSQISIGPDDTLYIGYSGLIEAINPDGSVKWIFETGRDGLLNTPVISKDGIIYAGSRNGDNHVYAINNDGNLIWEYDTNTHYVNSNSMAVGPRGDIYFAAYRHIYSINSDGQLNWSIYLPYVLTNHPAFFEDRFYINLPDYDYWAGYEKPMAFLQTGERLWKYEYIRTTGTPAIDSDGSIYVYGATHSLIGITSDGQQKWVKSGLRLSDLMLGLSDILYAGVIEPSGALNAYTLDGEILWSFPTHGRVSGGPVQTSNGTVYVGSEFGRFYAIVGE